MSDIQRALDKQAKLEAEATEGPWEFRATKDSGGIRFVVAPNAPETAQGFEFIPADCSHRYNGRLIAHLRNQAALARAVIEAAQEVSRFTEPEWRDDIDRGDADIALVDALAAWADHVNGDEKKKSSETP